MSETRGPEVSIALVRGINVGRRWIKMPDLRSLALACGFVDVVTYIETGNLLVAAHQSAQEVSGSRNLSPWPSPPRPAWAGWLSRRLSRRSAKPYTRHFGWKRPNLTGSRRCRPGCR